MSKSSNQCVRQWTRAKNGTPNVAGLPVSNENVCLPPETDLQYQHEFCDEALRQEILHDIEHRDFTTEGFSRRIRVQKYSLDDSSNNSCPESLRRLATQVQQQSLSDSKQLPPPTLVVVEEHSITPWSYSGDYAPNRVVAAFETRNDVQDMAGYYVARVVLQKGIVYHMNKPAQRQELLWTLPTPDHHTNTLLEPGCLLLQQGECLQSWRSYTTAAPPDKINKGTVTENNEDAPKSVLVKFARLPPESDLKNDTESKEIEFGYVAKEEDRIPRKGEMPSMEELLTIIVTTSPIKSHPSTELLERTFDTFHLAGQEFLNCPKVIVCDGYRQRDDGKATSKKHNISKQAMRNGIVTEEQANNYILFKERLQKLCKEAPSNSPFRHTTVEQLDERMGYGFALRHALRHCVSTPFVCVIQHDRTFMRQTPMYEVLHTMWRHRTIKYVGISMRSNLMYRDIFKSKYGKASEEEMGSMILRPPELLLDAAKYGPNGNSDEGLADLVDDKILKSIRAYAEAYQGTMQCNKQLMWVQDNPPPEGKHQLTLTPTLFWYDNTHICETVHYRDFVFHPKYKMVARGGFVEDKLSPVMKRTTERLGLTEGHARFGCYILDDHSGLFFTGHLDVRILRWANPCSCILVSHFLLRTGRGLCYGRGESCCDTRK